MSGADTDIIILALDPATETGWCLGAPSSTPKLGTLSLAHSRKKSRGLAFERFRLWLEAMVDRHAPTHIIFESPILTKFTNIHMTRMAQGLDAIIESTVARLDAQGTTIALSEATPGELKKALTGKGNAKKDAMMRNAFARGMTPENNNEADAFAAWLHLTRTLDPDAYARFDPINSGSLL